MTPEQWEAINSDIAVLRAMTISLALASPKLENVLAEFQRQQTYAQDTLLTTLASERYIQMLDTKMQALHDMLKAQL